MVPLIVRVFRLWGRIGGGPQNRKTREMSGPTTSSEFPDLQRGSLAAEPPNHHTLIVQKPRRAGKSEDSENERHQNQFRVFRFSAWLVAEP